MNRLTHKITDRSTQLRKAVFGGSQKQFSLNHAASKKQIPISMKLNQTLLAITIAAGLGLAGEAQANIVYDVNLAITAGGVVGTITTDGKVGVIGAADILSWNLTETGKGGATFNLVSGASGVEVGNITDPFNPNAGTPDLTADANHIYFNFDATDGGYFGFQTLPFYGGNNYWSCGAYNNNFDVGQGFSVVPVLNTDPSSIYVAESGNQIIATAATAGTQPNSFVYNNFATTKLIRFNGSATKATTSDGPVLELTPASANQAGSAFTSNHIVLDANDGFGTFFMFRMSKPGNTPAGGMTFTIQSASSSILGSSGSGLGYSGITNSLSVGFGADNHVSVNTNGVLNAASVNTNTVNDGNIWYAWVDYEGVSQDLEVRLSEIPVRPLAPTLAVSVNLPSILGGTNAFVGFTGATGAGWHEQDILAWKFMALPTTRVTGNFALTNLPPGFKISGGVVLSQYKYKVAGHTFTNYSFAPITVTTNASGHLSFASKPAELVPDSALPDPNAIDEALNNNAAALDAKDFMQYAVLATYENSTTVGEGALLSSYNNGSGFPPFLQNADFNTRYPIYEDDYVNEIYNMNQNSYPGLDPDPGIVEIGKQGSSDGINSVPVEAPMDADGNYAADMGCFSLGKNLGTLVAHQQMLSSSPLPLVISSPRCDGTNFVFNFGTVSNQSYSVWANADLATSNWVSYTNLVGDGYVQKIATPITNGQTSFFYRLSSP
ncbi:MAG TPA: L-type lectin-domain containing protein [Candidatus Limnocylindrales bacterium]|nr:L-type lectin-domain containing protein [Candidatus Limnocylindrales bacterium]